MPQDTSVPFQIRTVTTNGVVERSQSADMIVSDATNQASLFAVGVTIDQDNAVSASVTNLNDGANRDIFFYVTPDGFATGTETISNGNNSTVTHLTLDPVLAEEFRRGVLADEANDHRWTLNEVQERGAQINRLLDTATKNDGLDR